MISANNVTLRICKKALFEDVNIKFKEGNCYGLIGANGAGKSSLTKVIMADPNYKVLKGDIIYNGKSIINLTTDLRAKLGIFLAMQNPPVIDGVTNSDFLRTAVSSINEKNVNLYSFIKKIDKSLKELSMPNEMIHRSVNKGFSGGERKKNEILQMKMLNPSFVMLDEIDSGVDVDALKIVSKNINEYKLQNPKCSFLIITHYTHLLKYVKPDVVNIIKDGKIVKTGSYDLAKEIENNGFNFDKIESSVNAKGDLSE